MSERLLTLKTVLLLALSSLKRVGDLQALSVAPSYLHFVPSVWPKLSCTLVRGTSLRSPPLYHDLSYSRHFVLLTSGSLTRRGLIVCVQCEHMSTELPCGEGRTICWYATVPLKNGLPASKQTLSQWIVDAITVAYESSDLPSPLGVKAHSTRCMAASKAFLAGVPMQVICDAAWWSTALTFVRFYDLDLQTTPGSSLLLP